MGSKAQRSGHYVKHGNLGYYLPVGYRIQVVPVHCTKSMGIKRIPLPTVKFFFLKYTNILINLKVVMQVHHNSSHFLIYWVKTILLISNYDSDLYSQYSLIDIGANRLWVQ